MYRIGEQKIMSILSLAPHKMRRENTFLFSLGIFCLTVYSVTSQNSTIDESSLLALKSHTNSTILSQNWSQDTSFCTWIGVTCGPADSRVTGLNLSSMGLRGTIAQEIGNLSFLTSLDMSNNSIDGTIPNEIGNLSRLRVLKLSNNELSGDIPASLSACVELRVFDLSHNNLTGNVPVGFGKLSQLEEFILWKNQLSGELPSTIFNISSLVTLDVSENQMFGRLPKDLCTQNASKLEALWLYQNQFEGEILSSINRCLSLKILSLMGNKFAGNIPREFWNLSTIQMLGLGRNAFTGTIPPAIANLSNLMVFDIAENNFHGNIPSQIGQLSNLTWLNVKSNHLNGEVPLSLFSLSSLRMLTLSVNNLSGVLPSSIDRDLPNLEQLILEGNQFHGEIPDSISNLSKLEILDLSNNSFAGYIPITLGNLSQLQRLTLANNRLANNVSKPEENFLSSLTSCKNLNIINIDSNPITGVFPKSLGLSNLSASLQQFTAQSCRITGQLPNEIGNLTNLVWLNLGYNDLAGAIPAELGYLRNLQKLDLYGNKLQGPMFDVLCDMRSLYHVDLRENSFSGQLPGCLGNLSMLREVNFAHNAFSSNIPSALWSNEWIEKMNFSNNFLNGSLPPEIGNMKILREIDLSRNQISGNVPSTISQLQSLTHLSLSNNEMDGEIDESFAALKELQYLDLSNNNFSGQIPNSLEELPYLTYFNVSFNQLSGEIPDEGPFVNFTDNSFANNKGLCGASRFKVNACKSSKPTPSSKTKLLKYILPAVASSVLFAAVFLFFVRKKLSPSVMDSSLVPLHERISHHEILIATKNLDQDNLIGRGSFGSVYRGDFVDEKVAAIKVFNLDVQGVLKSFDVESQVMRNVRHRNLVKVIASCSGLNFKALVMAYMSNGNLEKWLYSPKCSLNIFQRLGIMFDVASAVEYLHVGLTFPIAHCDLKPNNILLDEDMVARVADFGIAQLLTREQRTRQTGTLGTVGYMAPEYGSDGLISTMVDVYSYGILLMEVFTRRKPTDEMFSGELTMRKWVSESYPNATMQIVDLELVKMTDESCRARHFSCLKSIIELALECTADLPEERPVMEDVLARIEKIRLNLLKSYK